MEIVPSILSADFGNLRSEIEEVADESHAIHFDVMDGHFVPNITIGPPVFNALSKYIDLPFHIHLMIEDPDYFADKFKVEEGDCIIFHIETASDPSQINRKIRRKGAKCGITLNPKTAVEEVFGLLPEFDLVLVMSVEPGFGGQEFIPESLDRINSLRNYIDSNDLSTLIEVDGGIKIGNVRRVVEAGADIIVAGSAIFGQEDRLRAIRDFRRECRGYNRG